MTFFEELIYRENNANTVNHYFMKIFYLLMNDEFSFTLHGRHNLKLTRCWFQENQHRTLALRKNTSPFIIGGNLNSEKYLGLLRNQVIFAIRILVSEVTFDRV